MKCPAPERWGLLAGGLAEDRESDLLLAHAASCAECAAVLKESIELLSNDTAAPEILPDLKTSGPEWRRDMSRRLSRSSTPHYWLPIAAALACVFAGSGAWWFWREQHRPPLGLLARAYSARRPVELRTPGAAWSEVQVERGNGGALQTPELLESEAAIARNIGAHSIDPAWLRAQGLAQLLEWKFAPAIESLTLAENLAPAGDPKSRAAILLDLATAYFERAKASGNALDYSLSLDSLSKALQADPSLDAALFNRAIVYEANHQYFLALEDWQKYLRRDRSGHWADEALRRQREVRTKIDAVKPTAGNRTDDLPEQRIENAMRTGLRDAGGETPGAAAGQLERENEDLWLRDALAFAGNPAVPVLASIVDSRVHMDPARFDDELGELDRVRAPTLPPPLEAWLAYEYMFRSTHPVKSQNAPPGLDRIVGMCETRGYWYILSQILLEKASLQAVHGYWADAEADVARARDLSSRHLLLSEEMRAMGTQETLLLTMGRYREAAVINAKGLDRFWSRPFPWFRGQQFYTDAASIDEALGRYCDASAAAATSARLAGFAGGLETEAVSHARSADFAGRAGMRDIAVAESRRARDLFRQVPDSRGTDWIRASVETELAAVSGSSDALRPLERAMRENVNPMVAVPYLRAFASMESQADRQPRAETLLRQAVNKLDAGFNSSGAGNRRQWRSEADKVRRALVLVLLKENRVEDALTVWDGLSAPAGRRSGQIAFARLGSRYAQWRDDGRNLSFAWLEGDADDIDRTARGYALLCAARWSSPESVKAVGGRLRRELRLSDATGVRLSVQPDGDLARIPWASLVAEGAEVEVRPVIPAEIAPRSAAAARGALIVVADAATGMPALPDLDREIGAVQSSLPDANVLRGPDATVANLQRALAQASVLHFAGHAISSPEGVALLVAPERGSADPDRSAGIFRLRPSSMLRLRRAVLSACATGKYEEAENAEPASLAQQMLQAGAGEVVASLWPVDSAATSVFMGEFYRSLRGGAGTAGALARAAGRLKADPEFSHPYYWASFEVFTRI